MISSMKLSDAAVRNARANGKVQKLSDGGGLYLHVTATGSKLWRLAYRFEGKQKLLSFGAYPAVSLKDARHRRDEAKELLARGIDPGEEKKQAREEKLAKEREERDTFEFVAREWFAKYEPTLSEKHAKKLRRYLENTIFPVIGGKPVTQLEPANFLQLVQPSERLGHHETAHKLMRLCGQVTRYARITGRVKYDVAAGLTEALTPVQTTHFAAVTLPDDIGQLLRDIDAYVGYTSVVYCLKILPYVFTRPSELRLAHWSEFDFKNAAWIIPASRMRLPVCMSAIRRREEAMDVAIKNMLTEGGIDVGSMLERCMGNEALLERLLKKFLADTSYARLVGAFEAGDGAAALDAAHTLKGVCGNMSITGLFELLARQVQVLRRGDMAEAASMVPEVTRRYDAAVQAIQKSFRG